MENRAGKFEKMETQPELGEGDFPHIPMGVLHARISSDSQRVYNKVLLSSLSIFKSIFIRIYLYFISFIWQDVISFRSYANVDLI